MRPSLGMRLTALGVSVACACVVSPWSGGSAPAAPSSSSPVAASSSGLPPGTSAATASACSGPASPPAPFHIVGITGSGDSTVDAHFTGAGFPTVAWTPSVGQIRYEVTMLDVDTGAVRCPTQVVIDAEDYTYSNCRSTLRQLGVYAAQVVAWDSAGSSTPADNSPFPFTVDATAHAPNCSVRGSGPVVANGVTFSTVTISLGNSNGAPLEGVVPTFSATNTGGGNTYGLCSASNPQGLSQCSLRSTVAERKTLTLLSPVELGGTTVEFVAGPATRMVWSQAPTSARVNVCAGPFTLGFQDAHHNAATAGLNTPLHLTQDGPSTPLFFGDAACAGLAGDTLAVTPQAPSATFSLKLDAPGVATVLVTSVGLPALTQRVTVFNTPVNTWVSMSQFGAPELRTHHVAVWTGLEMVVWGGYVPRPGVPDVLLASGGKYNSLQDVWTPVTTLAAPPVTRDAQAVWATTTQEMVVWGGWIGQENVVSGGRYNPATNVWRPTQETGAPTGRRNHAAVWTGQEMLVWGGEDNNGHTFDDGAKYNPVYDTWTPMASAPLGFARFGHVGVWTGREMAVWGGALVDALNDGALYNPALDQWRLMGSQGAPTPRFYASAAWCGGQMAVWGGQGDTQFFNSGARYNPDTDVWTAISVQQAPTPRVLASLLCLGSQLLVWGGMADTGTLVDGDAFTYSWDAHTWSPVLAPQGPASGRYGNSAVWNGGQVLLWGGETNPLGPYYSTGAVNSGLILAPSP